MFYKKLVLIVIGVIFQITWCGNQELSLKTLPHEIMFKVIESNKSELLFLKKIRLISTDFHNTTTLVLAEKFKNKKNISSELYEIIEHSLYDFASSEFSFPCKGLTTPNSLFSLLYKHNLTTHALPNHCFLKDKDPARSSLFKKCKNLGWDVTIEFPEDLPYKTRIIRVENHRYIQITLPESVIDLSSDEASIKNFLVNPLTEQCDCGHSTAHDNKCTINCSISYQLIPHKQPGSMKNEQEIIYKDFFSAFAKNTSENTTSITIDVNKLHGNTRSHIRNSNRKAIPICFRPIYSSVDPIYKLFGDPSKVARLETIYANTTNIIDAYHAKKRKQHLVIISSVIAGVLGLSIIYLLKRHKLWIAQKIKTSSAKISGPLSDLLTLLGYGIVIPVSIAGTVLIIAVPTIGALKILEMIFKN